MSDESPPVAPRFPLRTIQAIDDVAREFRRKLRDQVVRLSSLSGDASLASPDTIQDALPLACQELISGRATANERGVDGREPRAA